MIAEATPARTALAIVGSPCRHLESCVAWADDSGRRWAGRAVVPDEEERERDQVGMPVANTLQQRIEHAVEWCRRRGLPGRVIVLKGRRSGSSVICAKIVDLECKRRVTKALVMADVFKRSDEIFKFQSDFAESDVFPWRMDAPVVNARSITYGNGSVSLKETALDPNAGRGGGFRVLWFSECAHYPSDGVRDATRLMVSTLNTVPKTADSLVIAESTANGQSGWFYDTWQRGCWPEEEVGGQKSGVSDRYWERFDSGAKSGDGAWVRVFAAWFEIPRNAMAVTEEERGAILGRLDAAERDGVERLGWTAEQVKWRRWTIANDFKGDAVKFDQEYPGDPQSAFVASGSPAFTRDSLRALRTMAERAEWQYGVLEAVGATADDVLAGRMAGVPVLFRRTPKEEAWCAVLEEPRDGCDYVAACDPATGALLAEEGGGETDLLSALVLRRAYTHEEPDGRKVSFRHRVVARLMWEVMEWQPTERQTLYMLALLTRWYGLCTLVVETNKGEWVIVGAKQAGLNLYRETILSRVENKMTTKLGFTTTEESRHSIVTRLQSLVHGEERERERQMADGRKQMEKAWEPSVEVEDLHIIEEMETFVRDDRGRFAAASGRHDDDVIGLALAAYFVDGATRYRVRARRRPAR